MKKILILFFLLSGAAVFAGDLDWIEDYEAAKKKAATENKAMLVNFTGSDWCGWCKRLDREVFSKEEFAEFADKNLVLVKVDFPRYKQQSQEQRRSNWSLQSKYGVQGYPTILLVSSKEDILLSTGYRPGGAGAYIDHLKDRM